MRNGVFGVLNVLQFIFGGFLAPLPLISRNGEVVGGSEQVLIVLLGLLPVVEHVFVLLLHVCGAVLERGVGLLCLPVVVEKLAEVHCSDAALSPGWAAERRNEQHCGEDSA